MKPAVSDGCGLRFRAEGAARFRLAIPSEPWEIPRVQQRSNFPMNISPSVRTFFLRVSRLGTLILAVLSILVISGCAYSTMQGVDAYGSDEQTRAKLLEIFPVGTNSTVLVEGITKRTGKAPAIGEAQNGFLEGAIVTSSDVKSFIRVPVSGSKALFSGETRTAYFELDAKGRLVRITFTQG